MLPKTRRLDRKSFAEYFGQGFFISSPTLSLRVNLLKSDTGSRFSVVVAQKVTKRKPVRNLLKRQVYSIIEGFIPKLQKPVAGIFFLKKEALTLSYNDLAKEVSLIVTQAKLLK